VNGNPAIQIYNGGNGSVKIPRRVFSSEVGPRRRNAVQLPELNLQFPSVIGLEQVRQAASHRVPVGKKRSGPKLFLFGHFVFQVIGAADFVRRMQTDKFAIYKVQNSLDHCRIVKVLDGKINVADEQHFPFGVVQP
jgi:hypothetical protein